MARSRSPDSIAAEKLYNKGMSLVEIAKKLGKPEGTVRRWKSTQGWGDKNERSEKKANVRKDNRTIEREAIASEIEQVIDNPNLTDKQRLFCCIYAKCFNATKAYQKAFGCSYNVANAEGYKLLVKPCVKEEIYRLKQNRLNQEMLAESDIFQKYMDIAFADITDYTEFGSKEIKNSDTGEKIKYTYVNLKNSKDIDGTIISEVSKGRDGAKIKLNDRMKALDWLSEHMGMATPEQAARIEQINANTERIKKDASSETCEGVVIIDDIPESDKCETD